jgi:hypothetical protein
MNKIKINLLLAVLFLLLLHSQVFAQTVTLSSSGSLDFGQITLTGNELTINAQSPPAIIFTKSGTGTINWRLTLQGTDFTGKNTGEKLDGSFLRYNKTGSGVTGEFIKVSGGGDATNLFEPAYTNQSVKENFTIIRGTLPNAPNPVFHYLPLSSNFTLNIPGEAAPDTYESKLTFTFIVGW